MTSRKAGAEKLFLIDGTALAYRSHFAFIRNPLTTSKGRNVSAVYGYIMSLLRIMETEKPDLCGVAFDTPEPTFRHKKFEEYKATREKTPDELIEQMPEIKQVTEDMGIAVLELPGFEADDVIGTLAVEAAKEGKEVFLVTGDKDFMQLVDDRIRIYNIMKPGAEPVVQGAAEVEEKFGVEPGRVIEVMGLMGDTSDNIPGVRGVGEKTAIKLIREFGSIDALYENMEKVPGKGLKAKLETDRALALLSKELVTIDVHVPLEAAPDSLRQGEGNRESLRTLCMELEFGPLLARFTEDAPPADAMERNYILVDSRETYAACKAALEKTRRLVFDLETTSLDVMKAKIVGIALCMEAGTAYYLPANLKKPVFEEEGDAEVFLRDVAQVLADEEVSVCGQNIKYDLKVMNRAGVDGITSVEFDTMVAHYLLYPGEMRHSLDYMSLKHLNVKKIPTSDLIGKGKNQISMADVPVERVGEYACEDADMTFRLMEILEPELEAQGLHALFRDVEMPLVRVLEEMELAGVRVDLDFLKAMSKDLGKRLDGIEEAIYEMAGLRFNINSTQQLGKVLFDKLELHKELGLKKIPRTKTGYSTNAQVLDSMAAHPLPAKLLEYRQLKKLVSTYIDALPKLVNAETGRIHGSFNQTVAATGRLSSSDPNLQNIPIRTELGRQIRKAFIPRDRDSVLLSADYSQIELRILAHVSEDPALIRAFKEGEDIHRGTAALIFGVDLSEVTPEMRNRAKTINFGIIYGMGPHRLSREIGLSFGEAQEFIRSYFEAFSGVKGYIDRTLEQAREEGYVSTLLGRKRRIEEIDSPNAQMRSMAENMAVNTPIQGTAADLIKKAMIDVLREMKAKELSSRMILQVHDELLFDVPKRELKVIEALVKEKMEGALTLDVPVVVEMGHGLNWLEAH